MDLVNSPIQVQYGLSAEESSYLEGYNSLRGLGGVTDTIPFSYAQYYNGLCLYRFVSEQQDTVTGSQGDLIPLQRTGNVVVRLQFDKPLDSPKTVIMFGSLAAGFSVDRHRAVHIM
jgi:hypothetical protein